MQQAPSKTQNKKREKMVSESTYNKKVILIAETVESVKATIEEIMVSAALSPNRDVLEHTSPGPTSRILPSFRCIFSKPAFTRNKFED